MIKMIGFYPKHSVVNKLIFILFFGHLSFFVVSSYASEMSLPGSLKGNVSIQGRAEGRMNVSLIIHFYEPGKTTPAFSYNKNTDPNGDFIIEIDTPGEYVVTVKTTNTLEVALALSITKGNTTVANFGTLPAGDATNDNQVTDADFTVLSVAFGTVTGGKGYNATADFNGDGAISLLDFSLLAGNYQKKGFQITENSYYELTLRSSNTFYLERNHASVRSQYYANLVSKSTMSKF